MSILIFNLSIYVSYIENKSLLIYYLQRYQNQLA